MSRRRLAACLGVALAALVAGCTAQPEPTPSATQPVAANAQSDVNPMPRGQVRDGGLPRFPLAALPTQWNPRHPAAPTDGVLDLFQPLAPAHFSLDAAGRAAGNPDFVASAQASHQGPTVVTLALNPSAVWGDGQPITADDWVATWRAATGQVAGVSLASTAGWDRVAAVRAGSSATEVVVTYRGIDPDWAEALAAGPVRAASVANGAAFSWDEPNSAYLAGPFVVAHLDPVQGLVTLEPNPRWWGDPPKLERLMFRTVQPESLAASFQHNELDVWETGVSNARLQQARAAADTAVRIAPGTAGRTLRLATDGILADTALRRAVLLALDRDGVAQEALGHTVRAPLTWSNGLVLPTQPGYVDQARATGLGYDRSQAAQVLEGTGWTAASGTRTKDGRALTLTFSSSPDDPLAASELASLTTQLADVGVVLTPTQADADLTALTVPVSAFPLAHLPAAALTDPALADPVHRVATEVDAVRRADQASQLARLLWQNVTEIPLYQSPQFVAVRNGVANLGAPGYATTHWEDVGWSS
ncbi:MAG: ABC transporter substrate-binding protein [Actinomycetes bacterium]